MKNRFLKGLSYGFNRNLGKKDRIIRSIIAISMLISWVLGFIPGTIGIVLGIFSLMILGTALSARCGVTFWLNASTISEKEQLELDKKGIKYES